MITKTEAALVKLAADCLQTVDCASGPGNLDGAYITRLLGNLPAVRIVFLGGSNPSPASTALTVDASWSALVFTGWEGGDERSRRIGVDAANAIIARLAAIYHSVLLKDETGEPISRIEVHDIENLWSSAWDLANVAVYSITLESDLILDIAPEDLKGALDDFLRVRGPLVVPDPADDIDIAVDLPQS